MAMDKMRTLHDVIQLTNTVGGKVNSGGVQKDLDTVTKCWRNMAARGGKENAPQKDVLTRNERLRRQPLVQGAPTRAAHASSRPSKPQQTTDPRLALHGRPECDASGAGI